MSRLLQGVPPARAILSGIELTSSAENWEIRRHELRTVDRTQTGRLVETQIVRPPGYPLRTTYLEVGLAWSHIFLAGEDRLRRIRTRPGSKSLVLWRREDLAYDGNGDRTKFFLPNGWTMAIDSHVPSGGLPADVFAPVLRVDDVEIPISAAEPEDYDADPPPEGEAWWRAGTSQFKLWAAPAEGARVDLTIAPVYRVFVEPGESEKVDAKTPMVEPFSLLLLEDAG